eukprot:gene12643-13941_t
MDFTANELKDVKERLTKVIDNCELISCNRQLVQIKIVKSQHKQMLIQFQFPEKYPEKPILIELKSKVFPVKVLGLVGDKCDEEAKKLIGRVQIISMTKFIVRFIEENPLMVCSEEVAFIKKNLVDEQDDLKIKQKTGVLRYKIRKERYFLDVKISVPYLYPVQPISIEKKGSNFPKLLETHFIAESKEIARRCVEPPLKKDPRYAVAVCKACKKKTLPENPEDNIQDENSANSVTWIYCGHIYHNGCLDTYMKTPPFAGGKPCLDCGKRIYHEKWNISPELAEERWAHQEARKREIEEVSDFLDLM